MKKDNKEMPFVFYPSFRSQLKAIKNKGIRAIICEALIDYGVCGTEPDFSEVDPLGTIDALFVPMRQEIDKAKARYLACVENGKKGGAPKGSSNNPNGRRGNKKVEQGETNQELTQTNQELTQTNLDIDKDIDINGIKDTLSNISNQRLESKNSKRFLPPLAQKDFVFIKDLWNETCKSLRGVAKLTSAKTGGKRSNRKGAITACMNYIAGNLTENKTFDEACALLRDAFKKVEASNFLKGDNERGWRAEFDWVIKPDNLVKVLEGNYDNGRKRENEPEAEAPEGGNGDEWA